MQPEREERRPRQGAVPEILDQYGVAQDDLLELASACARLPARATVSRVSGEASGPNAVSSIS